MSNVSYPEDRTGISPLNKVPREPHVLTEINAALYRIIIPTFAPFYLDNFQLIWQDGLGVDHILRKDIDYFVTLPYVSASQVIQKMLYGGVAINIAPIDGMLFITYQTLGGTSTADAAVVRERLYELTENPRSTSWDVIANLPEQFPPSDHDHPFDQLIGADKIVEAIDGIVDAIAAGPDPENQFVKHLTDVDNPHDTNKEQVGLGFVENLSLATDAEVAALAEVDKYVTLKQVISILRAHGVVP